MKKAITGTEFENKTIKEQVDIIEDILNGYPNCVDIPEKSKWIEILNIKKGKLNANLLK